MKKLILFLSWLFFIPTIYAQNSNDYFVTTVTFPNDYVIGDYIEFATAAPVASGASAYYEVSIAYIRNSVAAAATHIVSSTHSNSARWQEAGRVNNNVYTSGGVNFTIDHNPGTKAFRIRAINTLGVVTAPLLVNIKIRSINLNTSFVTTNIVGQETNPVNLLPMTNDWDLIVGNTFTSTAGILAIKAISNGNVGIGTATPSEKLAVNGTIRAKEIKVDADPWPDYVFHDDYALLPLDSLEQFVKTNKHLPKITPAPQVDKEGIALGELNRQLLQKVEELTLYLIDQNKQIRDLQSEVNTLKSSK
ncbi:hypothetical protein LZQ00_10070 [Sphingobacterium sp. SRCM116780]|uniref:hypothetical protein n=1 Tax=Sphingobacterium sp. SRCM116780 TaxID=2907623 RepID=UPI001F3A1E03|nr:hypothetical protein [Sphingobacterium sp. SRCM116780]UIR54620.1 hypothetical protein LZQ00_10070 [Sphingobacterium sp. SRCM116780]